jgi:hypothetical protein
MTVCLTRWFDRWANKQGVDAQSLCAAVREMRSGLYEADLGGRLLKKRIARPGQGKRDGFRTLIATDKESRWIFVYGFAKNERGNLDKDEEQALKKLAGYLLTLAPEALERALQAGEVRKVSCDAQDKVSHT